MAWELDTIGGNHGGGSDRHLLERPVADRQDETGRDQNQGVHGPRGVQALGKGELAAPGEVHRGHLAVGLVQLGEERLEVAQELGGAAGVAGDEAAIVAVEPRAAPIEREEWR